MVVWLVGLTLAFVRLAEAQEQAKVLRLGCSGLVPLLTQPPHARYS